MKTPIFWAAGLALAVAACTPSEMPVAPDHLGLTQHTIKAISGRATVLNQTVTYSVENLKEAQYLVRVSLGDATLESRLDYTTQDLMLDGGGALLANDQKDALLRLSEDLYAYMDQQQGNVSLAESSLVRLLGYWSQAPTNYQYGLRQVKGEISQGDAQLRNEGITCVKKGRTYTTEYDDSRGSHNDAVTVGSKARAGYGCMGRCGADCGNWWIPSSWTKDCLDHDQCSNVNYSSGGSSDTNCGDEFDEAADDWTFGVWAGCSG